MRDLIRKRKLRLFLGFLALILPIELLLGRFLLGGKPVLLQSLSLYYYTEVKISFLVILVLFGLAFIVYGVSYSVDRLILVAIGILSLCIAFFPTKSPQISDLALTGYFHIFCSVAFFFLLGWVLRYSFNLPMAFPMLSKLGLYIWIAEAVLILYFLTLKSLWPPLVFLLETVILWLFTFGVYVRWQIDKRLGG